MKKLVTFCILFFIVFAVKAQSETETLEWLRAKQQTVREISSNVVARNNGTLAIDESSIKVSNAVISTNIQWNKVKDITHSGLYITIVGNELVDGRNVFIRLDIESLTASKYLKALKHMANLKGARMVKDDLF